jgi:hypothetical protein
MVAIVLIVAVAGGLYVTRERWTPWFSGIFGEKSPQKPKGPGDPNMSVFVEGEGYVYHRSGCNLMKKDIREVTLAVARRTGYKACTKCNPPD